jgi:hypothetical protein
MSDSLKYRHIYLFFAILAVSPVLHADDARPFDLYRPIIDKCLFGPPPNDPTVVPDKNSSSLSADGKTELELSKEQELLEKSVTVSALVQKPDGTVMVGFSDSSDRKTPVHYYLAVGESKQGWTVASADMTAKKVLLEKDGIEIERALGDKNAAVAAKPNAAEPDKTSSPRSMLLSGRSNGLLRGGLMSRRAIRRQETENQRLEDIKRETERKKAEEDAALRREQESAERAEQRQSLLALQEEMRKIREARDRTKEAGGTNGDQEL